MYLALKAFHLMAVISWFAAMFYLPRLFVYHAENREKKEFVGVAKTMEYKLYRYIGIPAFWATLFSGVGLIILNPALFGSGGWLHAKITLIVGLVVWFFHSGRLLKSMADDRCDKSGKYFRVYNEIPTLFMIAIVILAVVKPF